LRIFKHSLWLVVVLAIFVPPAFVRQYGRLETWGYSAVLFIGFSLFIMLIASAFKKNKENPLSVNAFTITAWLIVTGYIVEGFGFMFK
jgi:hypothetical protein